MKNKLIALTGTVAGLITPVVAFAQGVGCGAAGNRIEGTFQFIICKIGDLLDLIIPILIVLGVLYFVWGVVQYVIASDEEAKSTGRNRMIYGIIGLVVIVAMWGLVGIVTRTFGLNGDATITLPNIPY